MNQHNGNNNRGHSGDEMQQGSRRGRGSNQDRGSQGAYPQGDLEDRVGHSGYAEQRGKQFDQQGWGESSAGSSRGGQDDNSGLEFGGRSGQQGYGQRGGMGGHESPGQPYRSQGHQEPRHGVGYGGGSSQGFEQGRDSFGGRQGLGFGQDQGYGQGSGQGYGQNYGQNDGQSGGQGYGQGGSQGYGQNYGQGGGQGYGQRSASSTAGSTQGQGFRGKGPKGYKRSDERLQEDINERLMDDDGVDASDISVQCKDGVVTLEGTVSERRLKHHIEDLVEKCHGVTDIDNRITLKRGGEESRSGGADTTASAGIFGGTAGQKKSS